MQPKPERAPQDGGGAPSGGALPPGPEEAIALAGILAAALATGGRLTELVPTLVDLAPAHDVAAALAQAGGLGVPGRAPADPARAFDALEALAELAMEVGPEAVLATLVAHQIHPFCLVAAVHGGKALVAKGSRFDRSMRVAETLEPDRGLAGMPFARLTQVGDFRATPDNGPLPVNLRILRHGIIARGTTHNQNLPNGLLLGGSLDVANVAWLRELPEGLVVLGDLDLSGCEDWDGQIPADVRISGLITIGFRYHENTERLTLAAFRERYPRGYWEGLA